LRRDGAIPSRARTSSRPMELTSKSVSGKSVLGRQESFPPVWARSALCRPPFGGKCSVAGGEPFPHRTNVPPKRTEHPPKKTNVPAKPTEHSPNRTNVPPKWTEHSPKPTDVPPRPTEHSPNRTEARPNGRNIPPNRWNIPPTSGGFSRTGGTFSSLQQRLPRKGETFPLCAGAIVSIGGSSPGRTKPSPAETDGLTGWMGIRLR
jgi:hypothetical protein